MKDKWEKLTNLLDEYEIVEGLDKKAIEQIKENEIQKDKKRFSFKTFSLGAIAVVVAFAIALPIYFSIKNKTPEIRYYDEANITIAETDNLANEIVQNNLNVKCLELVNSINQIAKTVDTNEFAYFNQNGIYINDNGFDQVELHVAVLKNAKFDFEQGYDGLLDTLNVNGTEVVYINENKLSQNTIKARFEYNGYKYYLEITTVSSVEETLELYLSLLTT